MAETQCNHVDLKKLGGPIHRSGKDYYCLECGEQFKAEVIVIGIQFGIKAVTSLEASV